MINYFGNIFLNFLRYVSRRLFIEKNARACMHTNETSNVHLTQSGAASYKFMFILIYILDYHWHQTQGGKIKWKGEFCCLKYFNQKWTIPAVLGDKLCFYITAKYIWSFKNVIKGFLPDRLARCRGGHIPGWLRLTS